MSGGVGGVTGAIPLPPPDPGLVRVRSNSGRKASQSTFASSSISGFPNRSMRWSRCSNRELKRSSCWVVMVCFRSGVGLPYFTFYGVFLEVPLNKTMVADKYMFATNPLTNSVGSCVEPHAKRKR